MNRLYNYKNAFRILKGGKISLVVSAFLTGSVILHAAPNGGNVTSGNATISQSGNVTNIDQNTNKASINWQDFSIGKNETVNFNQPNSNSVTLNKVVGTTNSLIEGAMNANGQVILVNPNGVVFSEGSNVNVGGLIATTKNIKDEDFQNGNYKFEGDSKASVINKGNIKAKYVAMVGKEVINEGRIIATLGRVELAGANKFTLNINGDSLLKLTIDEGTLNALVKNKGIIKADGGVVYMTTQALDKVLDGMVNNSGVIEAQSLSTNEKGEVVLFAHGGTAEIGGEIKAEGGFVETSGAKVDLKDDIKIKAKNWLIDPYDIEIVSDSATETNITPSSGTYTAPSNSTKIKASTIQTALNGGTDVTVTTAGAGTQNGDITVNSAISWTSNSDLTLRADRNININQNITATGSSAKLTLEYRQTIDSLIPGDYYIAKDKKITLQDGQNFSTKDHNNQVVNYTVINSKEALQNINLNSTNLSGNWALGSDVNLSGENWTPLGFSADSRFSGKFDGLGHNISNLSISNYENRYIGLFGIINSATIQNLKITNATVSNNLDYGGTGILLGYQALAGGRINNIYIEGGSVLSSHSNGGSIGSVIGQYLGSELKNIYSTASVTATNDAFVGGIAGTILATKSERLYYKGNITVLGAQHTGYDQGATQYAGIGGLFGQVGTDNEIKNSGVEASITAHHLNDNSALGGFVGRLGSSTVDNSYSAVIFDEIGTASLTNKGAFIGKATAISGANNFYDSTLSSWNNGIGTGKTTTEMKTISTFDMTNSADWDITTDPSISDKYPQLRWATDGLGNGNTVWVIGGSGETVLSYTLSPLTGNYVYKGSDYNLSDLWSASSIFGSTYSDWIYGTDYSFIYGGNSVTGFTNAGTYNNISIDILKSGFTEATVGNTVGSFIITPKTVSISGLVANNKMYDGTNSVTITNWGSVDTGISGESLTLNHTSASFNDVNASNGKNVTAIGYSLSDGTGGNASNYTLASTTATTTANITKKTLTINGADNWIFANDKTYDGNENTTVDILFGSSWASLNGLVGDETIEVTALGTFDGVNAGFNKDVDVSFNLANGSNGGLASNYEIANITKQANILKKDITVIGDFSANDKVYDGNKTATFATNTLALSGMVEGEELILSGLGLEFDNKNAGNGKTVTLTGGTIASTENGNASNYNFTLGELPPTTTANITKKNVEVIGILPFFTKVYDGTTIAIVNGGTLFGVVNSDSINLNLAANYANENVGTGLVNFSNSISGADVNNYNLLPTASLPGNITKKTLTINGADNWIFANDKTYDGNENTTVDILFGSSWASLNGLVGDETIEVTALGTFDGVNAGFNKDVDVSFNLANGSNGGLASNYEIANITKQANILKKDITVIGDFSANDKVYDGNKTATFATNTLALSGMVEGEELILSGLGLEFDNKNAGNGKTVTLTGGTIASTENGNASNYNFTLGELPPTTTANITKKTLTINGADNWIFANDKTYDGNANTTVDILFGSSWASLNGLVGDETIAVTALGTFDGVNAGFNKNVDVSFNLANGSNGGLASNYEIANITKQANILKKDITVIGDFSANDKVYDGNKTATFATNTLALSGMVEGEDLILSGLGLEFDNKNAGNGKTVTLTGGTIASTENGNASNYNFTLGELPPTTTANITKKALNITGTTAENKVYDGNRNANLNLGVLTGFVDGETVNVSAIGTFDNKNVDNNKQVEIIYSLDDSNYSLSNETVVANIYKKVLTILNTTAQNKIYDGNNEATILSGTLSGLVENETLGVNATGTFDSVNAGNRTATVNYTLIDGLNGGLSTNYELNSTSGHEAMINKANVNYSVSGGTTTVGQVITLPIPSFTGGNPNGNVNVKIYDANNIDVTAQALAGTLGAGKYSVKTILTDNNYEIANDGNIDGILTINQNVKIEDIVTNIVNNAIKNNIPTISQPKTEVQNAFERKVASSIVNNAPSLDNNKSLGNLNLGLNEVIRSVNPSINNVAKDSKVTVVGETGGEGQIAVIELQDLLAKSGGGELRVALSPDSFVELVNGGVTLPDGVSQEFYVVEDKK